MERYSGADIYNMSHENEDVWTSPVWYKADKIDTRIRELREEIERKNKYIEDLESGNE